MTTQIQFTIQTHKEYNYVHIYSTLYLTVCICDSITTIYTVIWEIFVFKIIWT